MQAEYRREDTFWHDMLEYVRPIGPISKNVTAWHSLSGQLYGQNPSHSCPKCVLLSQILSGRTCVTFFQGPWRDRAIGLIYSGMQTDSKTQYIWNHGHYWAWYCKSISSDPRVVLAECKTKFVDRGEKVRQILLTHNDGGVRHMQSDTCNDD